MADSSGDARQYGLHRLPSLLVQFHARSQRDLLPLTGRSSRKRAVSHRIGDSAGSHRGGGVATSTQGDVSNVLNEEKKQQVIALGRLGWSSRRIERTTGVQNPEAKGREPTPLEALP